MAADTTTGSEAGDTLVIGLTASVEFNGGDAVDLNTGAGLAVAPTSAASRRFLGWAYEDTAPAVAGESNGDRTVKVQCGPCEKTNVPITGTGSNNTLATADIGKAVYVTGKQTYTVVPPTNGVICGIMTEIDSVGTASVLGRGRIRFPGLGSALLGDGSGQPSTIVSLTDNSGGSPADTIAAITNAANAGSADVGPTADGIASNATKINEIIAALEAYGILY